MNRLRTQLEGMSLLKFSAIFLVIFLIAFIIGVMMGSSQPGAYNGSVAVVILVWFFSGVFCVALFIFHFIGKWLRRV